MLSRLLSVLMFVALAAGCGGALEVPVDAPDADVPDAEACEVIDVASFSGCTTQPIPIRHRVASTEGLVVYVDGVALAPEQWTTDGNTVTISCLDPTGQGWYLVSVSVGCVVSH